MAIFHIQADLNSIITSLQSKVKFDRIFVIYFGVIIYFAMISISKTVRQFSFIFGNLGNCLCKFCTLVLQVYNNILVSVRAVLTISKTILNNILLVLMRRTSLPMKYMLDIVLWDKLYE